MSATIGDPRAWPHATTAPAHAAALHRLARASLDAAVAQQSDGHDREIAAALRRMIAGGDGAALAAVFDSAPSAAIYRHLWRLLVDAEQASDDPSLAVTLFAMPLVLVVGSEIPDHAPTRVGGVLPEAARIVELMQAHGALRGNRSFALSNALAAARSIDLPELPRVLGWRRSSDAPVEAHGVAPAPIDVDQSDARVHLRFIVGTALAAPGADLLSDRSVGKWGIGVTREIGRQLATPGVTLLVLPAAPQGLVTAVATGRAMQREVSAQLFASNALRSLRSSIGEPVAVISAHRCAEAPRGGELRVSLSSPLDSADAQGFRCPLYPGDHVGDVAEMLVTLMRDCRVSDVRVLPGVHADIDAATGLTLLFKSDAPVASPLH